VVDNLDNSTARKWSSQFPTGRGQSQYHTSVCPDWSIRSCPLENLVIGHSFVSLAPCPNGSASGTTSQREKNKLLGGNAIEWSVGLWWCLWLCLSATVIEISPNSSIPHRQEDASASKLSFSYLQSVRKVPNKARRKQFQLSTPRAKSESFRMLQHQQSRLLSLVERYQHHVWLHIDTSLLNSFMHCSETSISSS